MSSKKDFKEPPRSTPTGASSTSRLGQASHQPTVEPLGLRASGVGSASKVAPQKGFQPPSKLPPVYEPQGPDAEQGMKSRLDGSSKRFQEPSTIKSAHLGASKLGESSTMKSSRMASKLDDPSIIKSSLPSQLDALNLRDTSTTKSSRPSPSKLREPSMLKSSRPGGPGPSNLREPSTVKPSGASAFKSSKLPSSFHQSHHPSIHCPGCDGHDGCSQHSKSGASTIRPTSELKTQSLAPPTAKSILLSPEDVKMASRQTQFSSLAPIEQRTQTNWAQSMIKRAAACPENFQWVRRENPGGYQCEGGGHGMTDELLAEGKGGIMAHKTKKWEESDGPYYQDPSTGKWKKA